ncbi:hypothetical protein K438DRAFT_647195 [Mycena galopus ATCC 62051]|nr:hypothetical protein K438DRAFT_647195 [Mycena galopus ATCC 62051]
MLFRSLSASTACLVHALSRTRRNFPRALSSQLVAGNLPDRQGRVEDRDRRVSSGKRKPRWRTCVEVSTHVANGRGVARTLLARIRLTALTRFWPQFTSFRHFVA